VTDLLNEEEGRRCPGYTRGPQGCDSEECAGGWQFDLAREDSGTKHYSYPYATEAEALEAAEEWEEQQDFERETMWGVTDA
jgi:hypothetical protein